MKIRLLAAVQLNGKIVPRDSIVDWPDNLPKPMRYQHKTQDHINYKDGDALHRQGDGENVPLYVEIKEESKRG